LKKNLFILICFFYVFLLGQNTSFQLNQNWKFSEKGSNLWYPTQIPNSIHTDLYENGLIPHPFIGNNEQDLQWIADRNWIYQTEFELTQSQLKTNNSELVFEGLDTYAKVFLNNELILESNNAFRIWKIDVKKQLKKKNNLRIEFTPTKIIEEQKKKQIPYELPEGNRIFTRKAQFQYGWDWGPEYNTLGIWRNVYINFWNNTKIEDVYIKQINLTQEKADVSVEIELKNSSKGMLKTEIYVNNQLKVEKESGINSNMEIFKIPIEIQNPKLWWTNGLGNAYLYEFKIQIKDLQNNLIEEKTIKKGLRTIELITQKDEFGESFYFNLNGKPVFMKGANYIPQNSFQNWVKKENYEKLLNDVQDSNMNMLRIWGGGIYEDDYFYELCDEKGILVWQDFMFACAMYPGDELFLENVRQEAIDNVKRLRNHASMALWCGNNESSEGWHRWGWQDGRNEVDKREIWENYQKLFNGILPEIVHEFTDLPYWESSPKFGRGDERYISEGDAHDWWIWHDGHPFEDLLQKRPRFMSEFGFQSFPSPEVIRYINKNNSFSTTSDDFKNHQKHPRGFDIIKTYMERDFPVPENEEDYAFVTQLLQAYGIGNAIEAHRSNLDTPHTMGSLYWQLNDCWPSISWSGIDFFGNWKILQHRVKKVFEPVQLFFAEEKNNQLGIYIVNDLNETIHENLKLEIVDFDGNILHEQKFNFTSTTNRKLITKIDLSELTNRKNEFFINVNFRNTQNIYVPDKPKNWKLKDEPIEFEFKNGKLTAKSPIFQKNILFRIENSNQSYYLEEMLPGQTYSVDLTDSNFTMHLLKYQSLNRIINNYKTEY
jgi:beta-mannosidase